MNHSLRTTSDTHKSKSFDELAAKSTSSYHEQINFQKIFLNFLSVNCNLVIVSASFRSSVDFGSWEGLKDIEVEPLLQRRVLASFLDDFLGNDTTEVSSKRTGLILAELHRFLYNFFIKISKVHGLNFIVSLSEV